MTETGWGVLDQAHEALRETVAGLGIAELAMKTPCDQWNVAQVLQHAAGDQLGYASAITGEPGPTYDPFAPSGHLDEDAGALVDHALQASAAAWRTVGHDVPDVATPLPQGRLAPGLGAGACALDAAVHAWDVAVATGQPSPLTPDLARELMTVATTIVEPLRAYGVYAAAIEPEADDDAAAALLRYLGRSPTWSA